MIWGLMLGFVIGFCASLLANCLSPGFSRLASRMLSRIFHALDPNRFDLTGKWRQVFSEPNEESPPNRVEVSETVQVSHVGNCVTAEGQAENPHRVFRYELRVKHNLVFGSYEKKGERGNITGGGMMQLIVSPDRLQMTGQATWYDRDTNRIESSESRWIKV